MKERHLVLVVEDHPETADDLVQILESIGCASVVVDNAEDAEKQLQEKSFCLVLLDLQIKSVPDAIKGHVEHGKRVLRTIRATYGDYNGKSFTLPVLIVSGFARERDPAVDVMKSGANDIIQKPFVSGQVSERIRQALQDSGRRTHDACGAIPRQRRVNPDGEIVLAIPGDRVRRRRTRVTVAGNPVELTDASLKILLSLMVARQKGEMANKLDMGANSDQGFKGISNLRGELKLALRDVDIVENRYHGDYCFIDRVRIGECAFEKLRQIGNHAISTLVEQLLGPPSGPAQESEGNSSKFPPHRRRS
jgi:DNA-binding response OmpR family regulator